MYLALEEVFADSSEAPRLTSWVNGNLYLQSREVIGVLPVPNHIRESSGMRSFEATLDSDQPHWFLAQIQGTRKPILPVHSASEKRLFRQLRQENALFNSPTVDSPDWRQAVRVWNRKADEIEGISYKVAYFHSNPMSAFNENLFLAS